jgi:alpha-tubulin suppressor-like RCC1 family protein
MSSSLRFLALAILVLSLAACGSEVDDPDAGGGEDGGGAIMDGGLGAEDAGQDAGLDAGPSCLEGCLIAEVRTGSSHTCVRRDNGEVLCWGRNGEAQLGDGVVRHDSCDRDRGSDRPPPDCSSDAVPVSGLDDATGLFIGGGSVDVGHHTCALREDGSLWCWSYEIIGAGEGIPRQKRDVPVLEYDEEAIGDLAVSFNSICFAVGTDRRAVCYGSNGRFQAGSPNVTAEPILREPTALDLDPDNDLDEPLIGVVEIATSQFPGFGCALVDDPINDPNDGVWCWGNNIEGQLGRGDTQHQDCSSRPELREDCSNRPVRAGTAESPVPPASAIALGARHACVITSEEAEGGAGQVFCWGDNRGGQAGIGVEQGEVRVPTPVVGLPEGVAVTQLSLGNRHSCALLADGRVYCWGWNDDGQLGDGVANHEVICRSGSSEADCSRSPVEVSGLSDAIQISGRNNHVCALREGREEVVCWGDNENRQLGQLGALMNPAGPATAESNVPLAVEGIPE